MDRSRAIALSLWKKLSERSKTNAVKQMPKLSIIMGTYNSAHKEWLYQSVMSISRQTFTDWEFLICNDGSTNQTQDWLEELAQRDRRIRLIRNHQNCGLAASLNRCLDLAEGKYIARQDDDDISEAARLEIQINYLETHSSCDLVGTCAKVIDESGRIQGRYLCEEKPTSKSFLWTNPFAHPTIMMRTDVLKRLNGYRVAKETRRCEDYDLFMRLYAEGFRGVNILEDLYQYRVINNEKVKYRPMKDRIDEATVRFNGYCRLGLMPRGIPYVLKPIVVGLLPAGIYSKITTRKYKKS